VKLLVCIGGEVGSLERRLIDGGVSAVNGALSFHVVRVGCVGDHGTKGALFDCCTIYSVLYNSTCISMQFFING